ncbi:homoserine dehydrogenase [Salinibacillus xinjiangensis]|uniref:Homoserine dehydrogenase n=1 Tax=Salinibacillus xinjiangensis TaxID=1229268 RepID=A0A6G1XAQ2_9BACI|nr:homoserine dehydrogenase [Salinibacillus xinjiangensis]MRG87868.1 homoserine dehydrogenase [Salinibacillus xinjiangensis]
MTNQSVRVGLMGMGTVGTGVYRLVESHQEDLSQQTGMNIEIARILVQDKEKKRTIDVESDLFTDDPDSLLQDPEIDVIVEVMGGVERTREHILAALQQGKHVVTANKDLMAVHGGELLEEAAKNGCDLFYEASVAGGIPILRALVEGFSSDRITKMMGIVNGTSNYILTKMSQEGGNYEDVLKEAQELGYAEADPTADMGGLDAARKMSILSTLGFHVGMNLDEVDCNGMENVTLEDIEYAEQLGYTIKLIGIAKQDDNLIEVSVEPTMLKHSHPLSSVHGVFNAVYVYGEAVGETMFYGPGAGELPTANAVVSDLVTVVKNMKLGVNGRGMVAPYKEKKLKKDEEIFSKYFMRLLVDDQSGVLAQITQKLAGYDVSIEQVIQRPHHLEHKAELIIVTHQSSKKGIQEVLSELEKLEHIEEIKSYYRVENGD